MAGLVAAAGLQLRRDPAGGRQPVRVRRPRREACRAERRPDRGDSGSDRGRGARPVSEPRRRKILVVANETLTGDELLEAVRRRAAGTDVLVEVIAPVNEPREGYVVYDDTRRAAAGRRL